MDEPIIPGDGQPVDITAPDAAPVNTGNEGHDTPPTPSPDDALPQSVRDYLTQNPDHRPIVETLNKEFQREFTPRLQEAADLRKRFDGIDENTAAAIRHLQQLAQTDPRNAAHYLREQAKLLEGPTDPTETLTPPQTDPFDGLVPASDVEEVLLNRSREMEAWKQQQQQQFETYRMQQKAQTVRQEFADLQKELGIEIPLQKQSDAWELSETTQGRMSPSDAFFALNRSTLLPSLIQKAKDEASGVLERKAAGSAPGSIATRGGPPPSTGKEDYGTLLQNALRRET